MLVMTTNTNSHGAGRRLFGSDHGPVVLVLDDSRARMLARAADPIARRAGVQLVVPESTGAVRADGPVGILAAGTATGWALACAVRLGDRVCALSILRAANPWLDQDAARIRVPAFLLATDHENAASSRRLARSLGGGADLHIVAGADLLPHLDHALRFCAPC
jgi:hypothetical protein